MKKLLLSAAVTTPGTQLTVLPASVEVTAGPSMASMVELPGVVQPLSATGAFAVEPELFVADGVPAVKSSTFWSVSRFWLRESDVVLDRVGAAALPSCEAALP